MNHRANELAISIVAKHKQLWQDLGNVDNDIVCELAMSLSNDLVNLSLLLLNTKEMSAYSLTDLTDYQSTRDEIRNELQSLLEENQINMPTTIKICNLVHRMFESAENEFSKLNFSMKGCAINVTK